MAGSWLDALLGAVFDSGNSIPLGGGLNFAAPLTATKNPTTGVVDVTLPDASIGPDSLAVVSADGFAAPLVLHKTYSAGVAGTADDVTILLLAPFDFLILDAWVRTSTAVGASTVTLRTAAGGGGSPLTSDIATAATGVSRNNATLPHSVAAGSNLYLRRSDRGVAGAFSILAYRI